MQAGDRANSARILDKLVEMVAGSVALVKLTQGRYCVGYRRPDVTCFKVQHDAGADTTGRYRVRVICHSLWGLSVNMRAHLLFVLGHGTMMFVTLFDEGTLDCACAGIADVDTESRTLSEAGNISWHSAHELLYVPRLYIQIIIFAFPPGLVLKYASDTVKTSPSVPVDGKLGKRGLQLIRRVLGGPRNGSGDLDLPPVAGGRPKRPGDFPQGRLAAVPVKVVHPQRHAGPVVAALDGDGDGAGGVANLVAAGGV